MDLQYLEVPDLVMETFQVAVFQKEVAIQKHLIDWWETDEEAQAAIHTVGWHVSLHGGNGPSFCSLLFSSHISLSGTSAKYFTCSQRTETN